MINLVVCPPSLSPISAGSIFFPIAPRRAVEAAVAEGDGRHPRHARRERGGRDREDHQC